MGMMQEIEKLMNSVGNSVNYRIINLGGKSLYIEGIKTVISFSETEMQFQLKKCVVIVSGEQLKIKCLDKTTCVIAGEIFSVVTK